MTVGISIVMPLFNKEDSLAHAIESVLQQTYEDFELIIVNDGSTDGSRGTATQFNDSRIRLLDQKNQGVSSARNTGLTAAVSELVAFIDADDEWMPHFLETVYLLRSRFPFCKLYATGYMYRLPCGTLQAPVFNFGRDSFEVGILEDYFSIASRSDPPVWSSAVAVDREAIGKIGGFPVGVKAGEDLLTWARLACRYPVAYSSRPAAIFTLRHSVSGHPIRLPDRVDHVGEALQALTEEFPQVSGLRRYAAAWHKMRASVFLRTGDRVSAFRELRKAFFFDKGNPKLYAYCFLLMLPRVSLSVLSGVSRRLRRQEPEISLAGDF